MIKFLKTCEWNLQNQQFILKIYFITSLKTTFDVFLFDAKITKLDPPSNPAPRCITTAAKLRSTGLEL
jgi:hypothetical protein